MRLTGVRLSPVRLPGAGCELHATVVTIAGVDLPVAAALALSDFVPYGRRRLGRSGTGEPNPEGQRKPSAHTDGARDDGGGHLGVNPSPEYACGSPQARKGNGPSAHAV